MRASFSCETVITPDRKERRVAQASGCAVPGSAGVAMQAEAHLGAGWDSSVAETRPEIIDARRTSPPAAAPNAAALQHARLLFGRLAGACSRPARRGREAPAEPKCALGVFLASDCSLLLRITEWTQAAQRGDAARPN